MVVSWAFPPGNKKGAQCAFLGFEKCFQLHHIGKPDGDVVGAVRMAELIELIRKFELVNHHCDGENCVVVTTVVLGGKVQLIINRINNVAVELTVIPGVVEAGCERIDIINYLASVDVPYERSQFAVIVLFSGGDCRAFSGRICHGCFLELVKIKKHPKVLLLELVVCFISVELAQSG